MAVPKCVHQGAEEIGWTVCGGCKGRVMLKVFTCTVHERCTVAKRGEDAAACCRGCESYDVVESLPEKNKEQR